MQLIRINALTTSMKIFLRIKNSVKFLYICSMYIFKSRSRTYIKQIYLYRENKIEYLKSGHNGKKLKHKTVLDLIYAQCDKVENGQEHYLHIYSQHIFD